MESPRGDSCDGQKRAKNGCVARTVLGYNPPLTLAIQLLKGQYREA